MLDDGAHVSGGAVAEVRRHLNVGERILIRDGGAFRLGEEVDDPGCDGTAREPYRRGLGADLLEVLLDRRGALGDAVEQVPELLDGTAGLILRLES